MSTATEQSNNLWHKFYRLYLKVWRVLLSLVLIVSAAGIYFFFFSGTETVKADWWNDAWLYRQAIPVTNNTSAQTNVYISVTLNTLTASTSMQADCGDFRFTREDGSLLPYYIVSGCRSASNVIHINFDSFPAGAQTVYFYYGNPSAANGFSAADFSSAATSYAIGATQEIETGLGPVGYWSFDEDYGAIAHDESGRGNDGTITGTERMKTSCVSGRCLYFGGIGNYVDLPATNQLLPENSNWSASLWFKYTSSTISEGASRILTLRRASTGSAITLQMIQSSDSLNFTYWDGTGLIDNPVASRSSLEQKWHHISVSYDETRFEVFLDGVKKFDVVDAFEGFGTGIAGLGRNIDSNTYFFQGFIDEVKIYPYVRTADQIKQDYVAGLAGASVDSGVAASFGETSNKWMTDGLVGHWKMEESATTSGASDSSKIGNTGTFYGNASTTGGKFGNGGIFDGSGDYIGLSDAEQSNLDGMYKITISAWIKHEASNIGPIVSKDSTNGNCSYFLNVDDNGTVKFTSCHNGWYNQMNALTGQSMISADQWTHITIAYDGETLRFYKNGTEQISNNFPYSFSGAYFYDSDSPFSIGGTQTNGSWAYFDGQIDEVRVYNRALSKDEVRRLYEWAPGPVMRWNLDEKSGTTAYDITGNNNNGTLRYMSTSTNGGWTRGKYGAACRFDGTDDYILDDDGEDLLNGLTSLSVMMWVKSEIVGTNKGFLSGHDPNNNDDVFTIRYDSAGASGGGTNVIKAGIGSTGDTLSSQYESASNVQTTAWQHVAVTWTKGETLKMYINGALDTPTFSDADGQVVSGATKIILGKGSNDASASWRGLIDDVRIYNYVRTQKQILEDMSVQGLSALGGNGALKFPVLHLDFDKGYGTVADDSSGRAKNLTISSATRWRNAGKFGRTYYGADNQRAYDNADDNDLDFGTSTDFTLSAWVRIATNPAATQYILDKHDDTGYEGYAFYMNTSGQVGFGIGDTSSASFPEDAALSAADLADNTWHHIVGRKTSNSKIELFVDRVLAATDSSLAANATLENSATLYIGDNNATDGTDEFLGYVDEVRIYNFALNEDEINTLYNGSVSAQLATDDSRDDNGTAVSGQSKEYCIPGDTSECSAPVINLDFNEKSGTTAYDTSAYGRNGTLNWMSTSTNGAWTRGKNGTGLQFDGIDDYVSLSAISALTDYSIELWYKPSERIYSGNTGKNSLYTLEDLTDTDLYLYHSIADNGELRYRCYEPTNDLLTTTADWAKDHWYHIAATYSSAGTLKRIYVNGILENSQTAECPFQGGDTRHWLGAGTYRTNAVLDGLKVFNYERTPAQVAWDYNRGAPVAHWSFNKCEGSTIHDESVNSNHGQLYLGTSGTTATGTCASSSDSFWYNGRLGKYKSSGSFDGTNDYVNVGEPSELDFNGAVDMTVSAWVNIPSTTGSHQGIISKGSAQWRLRLDDGNEKIEFDISDYQVYSDKVFTLNSWNHILGRKAGSEISLWINGTKQEQVESYANIDNTSNYINIGRDPDTTSYFDGQIDEVKIWNYALSDEQVKMEYNGGAMRFGE